MFLDKDKLLFSTITGSLGLLDITTSQLEHIASQSYTFISMQDYGGEYILAATDHG